MWALGGSVWLQEGVLRVGALGGRCECWLQEGVLRVGVLGGRCECVAAGRSAESRGIRW